MKSAKDILSRSSSIQCSCLCRLLFFSFELPKKKKKEFNIFIFICTCFMEIWVWKTHAKLSFWLFLMDFLFSNGCEELKCGISLVQMCLIYFILRTFITVLSFLFSSFISSFNLRALKTRCLSENILFLRGESGPSTRDSFTYGESVHEAGVAPPWGP